MARIRERFEEPREADYPEPPPAPAARSSADLSVHEKHCACLVALIKKQLSTEALPYDCCSTYVLQFRAFVNEGGSDEDFIYDELWFPSMLFKQMLWVTNARLGGDSGSCNLGTVLLTLPLMRRHLPHVVGHALEAIWPSGEVRVTVFRLMYDLKSTAESSIVDGFELCSYSPGNPPKSGKSRTGGSRGPRGPRRPRAASTSDAGPDVGPDAPEGFCRLPRPTQTPAQCTLVVRPVRQDVRSTCGTTP
jgi:hypothetical protein